MTYQLSEPWMQEPGYARFTLNDFECAIIRHQELGHLCGYVGLFRHHALFADLTGSNPAPRWYGHQFRERDFTFA